MATDSRSPILALLVHPVGQVTLKHPNIHFYTYGAFSSIDAVFEVKYTLGSSIFLNEPDYKLQVAKWT